jgi:ketosteroid isomerase-like protein
MDGSQALVDRLVAATNDHDLDALVSCFADDYENETPLHPSRGFHGREQVRRNWEQIFAFVPDVHAEVMARASQGDTAWTEWRMTGTRSDGSAHRMAGVIMFDVRGGVAHRARFYLEPVDEDGGTVDDAVRAQVGPT